MNKKLFVTGITILFLGLAFAPSIHANISKESELVEITTEVCGLPGQKPQTVQLTKEDAEAVDRLFDEIKLKLDNVESREDTVEIFNKAVVELDKYGLLGGLSVKQAKQLIIETYQRPVIKNIVSKQMNRHPNIFNDSQNYLCLVAGNTTGTYFMSPLTYFSAWGLFFFGTLNYMFEPSFEMIYNIFLRLYRFVELDYTRLFPLTMGSYIFINEYLEPATGWVYSIGLNGNIQWNGNMMGTQKLRSLLLGFYYSELFGLKIGLTGFTGLKIVRYFDPDFASHFFYLGTALKTSIEQL